MTDRSDESDDSMFLAVVGMAGRFPKVSGLDGLWRGVEAGGDLLTRFPPHPDGTVSAFGVVAEADRFDASFFGVSPHEARAMDPQHRVFLECAWEALEHAGCDPARFAGRVGVYGGAAETEHMVELHARPEVLAPLTSEERHLATDLSFMTTRAAFHLGLTGPCVTVLSHCASALLAVHTASQALLGGECDLALAGGVTMVVPQPDDIDAGDGAIAADGHVRAFDARADGVVVSNGAALVALRRLEDALADGDRVHAVIRGSAVNNDGARKNRVGTPSVEALTEVMRAAHDVAEVTPDTIDYVEATYGASPKLANPIEMAALRRVFGSRDPALAKCRLGSMMSHVGHTEAVCGAMALLILIQGLNRGRLPGTAHCTRPDPELDLDSGPFAISATTTDWPRRDTPRRAAITNSGRGGTNVHMVIEEPPPAPPRDTDTGHQLLPVSARDPLALRAVARRLAESLRATGEPLADVAWTLQTGRAVFAHRGFVVAAHGRVGPDALTGGLVTATARATNAVFACGDDSPLDPAATASLYRDEPVFRAAIDECAPDVPAGADTPPSWSDGAARVAATQYALGRWFLDRGVDVERVVSDGVGDYAAAALTGLLTPAAAVAAARDRTEPPRPAPETTPPWRSTRQTGHAGPAGIAALLEAAGPPVLRLGAAPGASDADGAIAALDDGDAAVAVLTALGRLWIHGVAVDWSRLHADGARRKVALPTYPFARRRFRLDERAPATRTGPVDSVPRWMLSRQQRPDARLRLYCFPHSGGAAGEYMKWADALPEVEVWAAQLPGRGSRVAEPPIASLPTLAERMVTDVDFAAPFAFFGHSFGALLAFEVARRLRDRGLPGPALLGVSACRAPDDELAASRPLYPLEDAEFIAEVERMYGPLPSILHHDAQLRALTLPSLRADIEAAEEYRYLPDRPLDCPMLLTGGVDDTEDESRMNRWKAHTSGHVRVRMFDGGHFYFRQDPPGFLSFLRETLRDVA